MAKKKVITKAVTTKEEVIDTTDLEANDDCAANQSMVECTNMTGNNIFTTQGRVMPGQSILLLPSECDSVVGLTHV